MADCTKTLWDSTYKVTRLGSSALSVRSHAHHSAGARIMLEIEQNDFNGGLRMSAVIALTQESSRELASILIEHADRMPDLEAACQHFRASSLVSVHK